MIKQFFNHIDKVANDRRANYSMLEVVAANVTILVVLAVICFSIGVLLAFFGWYVIAGLAIGSVVYSFTKFLKAPKND